jgi:class 3 adenylate cyclase/TolB-like protein/ketosteroid isomerase-like protein
LDRKLAAILSADVQGYSRLMSADEEGTIETLNLYRRLMTNLIEQHRGRVVDSPGDNVLAEFGSVVDAVQGAVAIQLELNARNLEVEPDRRMEFRIGVNLGDVVADGDRIYGDGVNIAARVEGLAEAGGICISGTVHEHIRNKLPLGYVSLGEQSVKNISQPILVYRVRGEPEPSLELALPQAPVTPGSTQVAPASAQALIVAAGLAIGLFASAALFLTWNSDSKLTARSRTVKVEASRASGPSDRSGQPARPDRAPVEGVADSAPLPEEVVTAGWSKPSISAAVGVMHFKALVPDTESAWMTEAIRDNLNGQLSKVSGLEVYSKEYIDFLAEDGATNELKVAHELGIAKMISGSYIVKGDRLRIEAHIVNVKTGMLEESDSVEGPQNEFFEMQAQLAFKIAGRLDINVSPEEQAAIASAPASSSIDAFKLLMDAEDDSGGSDSIPQNFPERPQSGRSRSLDDSWSELLAWAARHGSALFGVSTARADTTNGSEQAIREVLERYRRAYETKDLELLSSIYTELSPKQKQARVKYFQNTKDLVVQINDVRIAVRGDNAVAIYTRADQFKDTKTGETVKLDVRLTKKLRKADGDWKMIGGKK